MSAALEKVRVRYIRGGGEGESVRHTVYQWHDDERGSRAVNECYQATDKTDVARLIIYMSQAFVTLHASLSCDKLPRTKRPSIASHSYVRDCHRHYITCYVYTDISYVYKILS